MIIAVYVIVIAALLLFPQVCVQSARSALTVWGLHVVPSLFPYMVFSKMLAERIRKTGFPATITCMLLGTLGGSPSGAAIIASMALRLQCKYMLSLTAFTGTISPMFFLGTFSQWTAEPYLPVLLYASQFFSAVLASVCVHLYFSPSYTSPSAFDSHSVSTSSLVQSIDAVLQIGGCIICFSVLASIIGLIPLPTEFLAVIHSVFEVTGGMHAVMQLDIPALQKHLILASVSGFGGLSILTQNYHFLKPLGITYLNLFCGAVLRAVFSALFMLLLSMI